MTIMQISIPDDLKASLEKAFPGETIAQAVERLLRAEVAKRTSFLPARAQMVREKIRTIREASTLTSDDDIRVLRHEGRP